MKCKDCGKEFNPIKVLAWGREIQTVRCEDCRNRNKQIKAVLNRQANIKPNYCHHGIEHQNPGGYCNICGSGRDFS